PDLPTDRRGRILDGTICYGKKNGACTLENGKIIFVKNNLIESGTVMFSEKFHDDRAKIAIVQSDLGQDLYHMFVFANHIDFESWFQTGGQKGKYEEAVMHLTKGCRDTNPMTLHAALTRLVKGGT